MKSSFSLLLFILLPIIVLAQTDPEDCYRDVMADAIIKTESNSYVFETFNRWADEGNPNGVLNSEFRWVFRDGNGNLLDDAELLAKVGQDGVAERMREIYRVRKQNGTIRLIVGIPLGIAMTAVGGYWMDKNFENREPSTLDQSGAVVSVFAGVGVIAGATISFFGTRKIDPYDHDITGVQSLEVLDRHNKAAEIRCRSSNK